MTIEQQRQIVMMVGGRTFASPRIAGPQQVSTLPAPHRAQIDEIALLIGIGGCCHVDAHH
jgi:hypothetical protein